LMFILTVVS
jgi:hypothetical protein